MEREFKSIKELKILINGLDDAETRSVAVASESDYKGTEEYIGIWNSTKGLLEGIVHRKNSTVISHKDAFQTFINAVEEKKIEISGMVSDYGGCCVIESEFKNMSIDDGSAKGIIFGVKLENDYCRGSKPVFKGDGFGVRGVCNNGMVLGGLVTNIFKGHNKVAELNKDMLQFVDRILKSKEKLKEMIDSAKKDIVDDADEVVLGEIKNRKKAKKIIELFETTDNITRYTIYNALTEYATHSSKDKWEEDHLQKVAQRVLICPQEELERMQWKNKGDEE